MNRKSLVFRRAPIWTRSIGISLFVFGGWVLWRNVQLTLLGLVGMGIAPIYGQPLGWAMAGIEAAVSIFVTSPENWDDIWGLLQAPLNHNGLPKIAKFILSSAVLGLFLTVLVGVYYFDYSTTFIGLFPNSESPTAKQALIVLALNLGTEVCSFFGFQSIRISKIAGLEVLEERLTVEPQRAYNERMLSHLIDTAKRKADAEIRDREMQQATYMNNQRK